jgi:HD-GYP domain-containing protein (c-di-GMP phosphodiesterase class II)
VLKLFQRLSLDNKSLIVIISCVILSIAVLTVLIIRHETLLLESDSRKAAQILATSITTALKDNMLSGRPDETLRLIKELSALKGVKELSILKAEGGPAFNLPHAAVELDTSAKEKLLEGHEVMRSVKDAQYLITPLRNEEKCHSCHADTKPLRGIVVVKLSTDEISQNVLGLTKRMVSFGVTIAAVLSALLIVFNKWLILSPIKGLTEAVRQMTRGNFVLFRQRGTDCRELLKCKKVECPSFGDNTIPCWLTSGTLCEGKPVGDFALKLGDCLECRVYKELRGDEIRQLIDKFNRMSLTVKKNNEDIIKHAENVEAVNQQLERSNAKLSTLLDASRLTTSTLELDQILSTSLRIILNVTHLKAGIILLLEEDLSKRCYEFFECDAYNCPAYKAAMNCWRLSGTMCHGDASTCPHGSTAMECYSLRHIHTHYHPARDFDEKINACSNCKFFTNIVLIPRMVAGFENGKSIGKRLSPDSTTIHKALVMGRTIVNYSKENPFHLPIETTTELAMPLKVQEQMIGILYLASDAALRYSEEEIAFFQLLSEVISSGIFNSRLYDEMEGSYLQTVMALANAIEAQDPYTKGHSERMAELSDKIAVAFDLSKQEREHLKFAALLHDVGKIGIGKDILWKDCSLDESEETEIMAHPDKGIQILEPVNFLKPIFAAIRHHHERFDGSGYPLKLKGKEIPFKARIISVADAWDAMLSNRPYRDALSIEHAKKELESHAGTQFDPEVVAKFLEVVCP